MAEFAIILDFEYIHFCSFGGMLMPASMHTLTFPGVMNERGFWLYVWRIESPKGELLYVGRTGDESSANAASPVDRMGGNLDEKGKGNRLRHHIEKHIKLERCTSFQLISYGPLWEEQKDWSEHKWRRDKIAALEKKLADTLGFHYKVMNKVLCRRSLDESLWREVHQAFTVNFPKLACSPE